MATKKKKELGPQRVRATGTDEGTVVLSVGAVVVAEEFEGEQTEHEWVEDSSITLHPDDAAELVDALPNAIQDARAAKTRAAQRVDEKAEADKNEAVEEELAAEKDGK